MIKGIMALFTSGVIFNPMVLSGVVLAIYAMMRLKPEQMQELFADYNLYALVAVISFAHTFLFKKVYKEGGIEMNYTVMILYALFGVVKFVLACGLTISFVMMISF